MILQALLELAENEDLMKDPDFERKPVAYLVKVGKNGKFLGINSTHSAPDEKSKQQPKIMRIPLQPGRSGPKPPAQFFVDNCIYVFGISPPDKAISDKKLKERRDDFRRRIEECAKETGDERAMAVAQFLEDVAEGNQEVEIPEDCASNDRFAFIYEPDKDILVHERPAIEEYWSNQRKPEVEETDEPFYCLVSGKEVNEVGLFPQIMKVPGGSSSGVSLVSFNQSAFESYGLDGNENAPISEYAARACSTALNRLVHPEFPDPNHPGESLPSRRHKLSKDTLACFWSAEKSSDDFLDFVPDIFEAKIENVRDVYTCIFRGETPPDIGDAPFYALILTGVQGRVVIRDWFESTLRNVADNLARYFRDIGMVRNTPPPKKYPLPPKMPVRVILESVGDPGRSRSETIPPAIAADLVKSALLGLSFPRTLLQRAARRYCIEIGNEKDDRSGWQTKYWNDARAAIIKAVLIRTFKKEVTEKMDKNNTNTGYLLGRLLAVVEKTQEEAMGKDINATIIDRFFSAATASPASIFPRLMKKRMNHIRKLRSEGKKKKIEDLEDLTDEILSKLNEFPLYMPIEDQAFFILGYHQQRYELKQIKKKEETEEE